MGIYYLTTQELLFDKKPIETEPAYNTSTWISTSTANYSILPTSHSHYWPTASGNSTNSSTLLHHNHDSLEIDHIGQIISILIQLLAFPPCVIGNIFVFIVLARNRRLRTNTNGYVLSLSIADFLVGVLVIPLETVINFLELMSEVSRWLNYICIVHQFLLVFLLGSSLTAMLLISIDRYIAISHPFFYTERVNGKVIKRTIVFGWIFMLALSAPILVRFKQPRQTAKICNIPTLDNLGNFHRYAVGYGLSLYAIMMLIFIGNIVLYVWVARIAVIQHMRISSEIEQHQRHTRTDIKNTKVLILMFGVFIIFWLPFMIIISLQLSDYCNASKGHIMACSTSKNLALSFGVLNSCVNCYIYAWQKRDFKSAIRRMICVKRRRGRITSLSATLPALYRLRKGRTNSAESTFTITSKVATRRTDLSLIATVGYESEYPTANDSYDSRLETIEQSKEHSFNSLKGLHTASKSSVVMARNQRRVSIDTTPHVFCTSASRRNSGIHFTASINELNKANGASMHIASSSETQSPRPPRAEPVVVGVLKNSSYPSTKDQSITP